VISARFALPTACLLAIALVPTTIHTYRADVLDDGLTATAVPEVLDGMPSTPTDRKAAWVRNILDSTDWIERTYQVAGDDVELFVGRSYDAKRLYHHPELALLRGTETEPAGVERLPARMDVPLHVLRTARDGRRGVAVYVLIYDGRLIENPVLFQLRTSAELLVSRRRPMTLLLASDLSGRREDLASAPATRVVLAALDAFSSQQPAAAGP
jgi:hypothetical protein